MKVVGASSHTLLYFDAITGMLQSLGFHAILRMLKNININSDDLKLDTEVKTNQHGTCFLKSHHYFKHAP